MRHRALMAQYAADGAIKPEIREAAAALVVLMDEVDRLMLEVELMMKKLGLETIDAERSQHV